MIREVDLVSYLPLFLAGYKELRETLAAEDPEFKIFWESADRVLRNEYIATADEFGISRFEKMLGLLPSKEDKLEARRARVLLKFNTKSKYTVRTLREVIAAAAGEENYYTQLIAEEYCMIVQILNHDMSLVRSIYNTIIPMLPANIKLLYYGRYVEKCELSVRYAESIRFRTSFYPRFNLPKLKLDGGWKLAGKKKLGGYDSGETVDLYPVELRFRTDAKETMEETSRLHLLASARALEDIHSRTSLRVRVTADRQVDAGQQIGIRTETEEEIEEKTQIHLQISTGNEAEFGSQAVILARFFAECDVESHQEISIRAEASEQPKEAVGLRLIESAQVQTDSGGRVLLALSAEGKTESKEQMRVRTFAANTAEAGGITVYNQNRMDSGWKLSGSRKLNGGTEIR